MNINLSREELNYAINMVQRAISARSPIGILDGILMEAKDNTLSLTGYDTKKAIICTIPATVSTAGRIVLRSRLIADIVRRLPEDRVFIKKEQGPVVLRSGKAKFEIDYLDGEYPALPEVQRDYHVKISQDTLKSMIENSIFSASTDPSRPILNGLNFRFSNNDLQVVAIDGFRMARQRAKIKYDAEDRELNIPAPALQELARVLDKTDDPIDIYSSDQFILFDNGKVKLISILLNGNYIDYKDIVPKQFMTSMIIDRQTFLDAVERSSLVINFEMKRDPITLESIGESTLKISARTEVGTAEEEIPCQLSGEAVDIDFNPRYLTDALRMISDDEIKLSFAGTGTSLLIEALEGDEYLYLILPVRR
ncbi:MAG: DNA polymerase III subunit beta [Eubacteriales bacterium]|nr:DNA polymerase III subunit beta [Eubacteriales bacterium]